MTQTSDKQITPYDEAVTELKDIRTFLKEHLSYCREVSTGKKLDDQGSKIQYDLYWKGVNGAYVNSYNAVNSALKRLGHGE